MASLKRSKTLPADAQTTKFLYTILKQLDLKSIDWNLVAQQLEITNGHAARMRFSRFRQHMEGIPTNPRGPRAKKPKTEKAAAAAQAKKQAMFANDKPDEQPHIKSEPGQGQHAHHPQQQQQIKQEPPVIDPLLTQYTYPPPMGPNSGYYAMHPHPHPHPHQHHSPYPYGTVAPSDLTLQCALPPQHAYGYPLHPAPNPGPEPGENLLRIKTEPFETARAGSGAASPSPVLGALASLPPGTATVQEMGQGRGQVVKMEPVEGS